MRDDIDSGLNALFGNRGSDYTLDEIKKAQKRQKEKGGTLMDNIKAVTGKTYAAPVSLEKLAAELETQLKLDTQELEAKKSQKRASGTGETASAAAQGSSAKEDAAGKEPAAEEKKIDFNSFDGIEEKVGESIFGQQAFLRKLVIAFKRPFAMGTEDGMPANSFYIGGGNDTGRHAALIKTVEVLAQRGIVPSAGIASIDLSAYPEADGEKLFLQDLFSAVSGPARVIVFENYGGCHPTYLNMLANLVMKGEIPLSSRYVEQNGQLVGVTNAFAGKSVGSMRATGHYLVFLGNESITKLTDLFGAPFVNALGDICITSALDTDTFEKVAGRELDEFVSKASRQLGFYVSTENEDKIRAFSLVRATKDKGIAGIIGFFDELYKALAQVRLENSFPQRAEVRLTVNPEGANVIAVVGEHEFILSGERKSTSEAVAAVKEELAAIIGLGKVKEYVLGLEEYYSIQQRRKAEGLKAGEVNKHMIFTGNPGTGKTTIARIVSRYLKAIGVLSGGQLVEVTRADLVGQYVGHTAPLTTNVIKSAIGGVLFIDEAYSLYRGKDDTFGLEAIDTLVKGIEDNRDDLIVILAGYSKEMAQFLESNSGLKSRFPNLMDFPDYSASELLAIAESIAKSKGYNIGDDAKESLLAEFGEVQATRASDAGNGRYARNRVEEAILNQSRRLVAEPDKDLSLLTAGDFVNVH